MSEWLILIGGDAPEAPMAWARADGQRILARGMADEGAPPETPPARTLLVLPGADARLTRLDLPARADAQARAGAEMLIGASLAAGEAMHYAVGAAQNADGARLVAAISASRLTRWMERCQSLGAEPNAIYLDCTLWPVADDEAAIVSTPNRVIVAAGARGGFSIEPALAPALTKQWLAEHGRDLRVAEAPADDPIAVLALAGAH
nr:type II secretion system protein GspL [Terricaulis sp.]